MNDKWMNKVKNSENVNRNMTCVIENSKKEIILTN